MMCAGAGQLCAARYFFACGCAGRSNPYPETAELFCTMGYTDFWKSIASLNEILPLVRFMSRMALPRRRWYCDRVTDGFPCKERGSRFKRNFDAERDEALLICKRLRDRMYARLLRYMDASPAAQQNLIPMDWEQYDAWSENARLARMDYLSGKLTAEEFLRKIDTMHDLESYAVTTPKEPPKQTIWQRLVAKSIGFDAERHYPESFQMLDLTAANPTWQTISADELRARDQEGHRSLRDQYGKK